MWQMLPLPSGIVRDKSWMVRIRFCSPAESAGKLRALVGGDPDNASSWIWSVSSGNLIWGVEEYFGNESKENATSPANNGGRVVSAGTWNSLAAYFAPGACSATQHILRTQRQGRSSSLTMLLSTSTQAASRSTPRIPQLLGTRSPRTRRVCAKRIRDLPQVAAFHSVMKKLYFVVDKCRKRG